MIFTKAALKAMGRTAASLDHAENLRGVARSSINPSNFWRMLNVLNVAHDDGLISFDQYDKYRKILDEAYQADFKVLEQREKSARQISMERMMNQIGGQA